MNDLAQAQAEPSLRQRVAEYFHKVKTDFPASLEMLASDICWINRLPEHVPFGGEYRGREGVIEYFELMAETFVLGEHPLDEYEFIESGDTLVIIGCEKGGVARPTGKVFDLPFVWVLRFDEAGRIRFLQEHNDTAAIGAAFLP